MPTVRAGAAARKRAERRAVRVRRDFDSVAKTLELNSIEKGW